MNQQLVTINRGWVTPPASPRRSSWEYRQSRAQYTWRPEDEWPSTGRPPPRQDPPVVDMEPELRSPQVDKYYRFLTDLEEAHYRANSRVVRDVEDEIVWYVGLNNAIQLGVTAACLIVGWIWG